MRNNNKEVSLNRNAFPHGPPDEKDHLAALPQHKTQTQAKYYCVHDKVREVDLGRRAVSKLVSLKTASIHESQEAKGDKTTPKPWTARATEKLKQLFKEDLETGATEGSKVKEKLSTAYFPEDRSVKAMVLKIRRIGDQHVEGDDPPPQEETFATAPTTDPSIAHTSGSVFADSSRLRRKFTEEQVRHLIALTKDVIVNRFVHHT